MANLLPLRRSGVMRAQFAHLGGAVERPSARSVGPQRTRTL